MPSFTGTYSVDVFISYGHIDNTENWITDLHAALDRRLKQLLGATENELVVWRDTRLERIGAYKEQLRGTICDSAVFISILTPRYLVSDSCKEELDWFVGGRDGRGSRADKESRLICVGKTWLQDAVKPSNFTSALGFDFYEKDPFNPDQFHEFGSRESNSRFGRFSEQLESLAQATARLLRKMRRASPVTKDTGRTIFLAPVASDLRPRRESIKTELTSRGHTVLPDEALPDTGPELRAALKPFLENSNISIHLCGAKYGSIPESETQSYSELVYNLTCAERSRPAFRQLVWIPEDLQNPDPAQKTFLSQILDIPDGKDFEKHEVFRTSFESFKEGVLDLLSKKPVTPEIPTNINAKAVYLLCDHPDLTQDHLEKVKSYLRGRGHPVELPAFQGELKELREMEEETIADTDAALIYYGTAQDVWVKRQRMNVRKILSSKPGRRDYIRALYLAAPRDEIKTGSYLSIPDRRYPEAGFPPLLLLGDCEEFRPENLEPFLQLLES